MLNLSRTIVGDTMKSITRNNIHTAVRLEMMIVNTISGLEKMINHDLSSGERLWGRIQKNRERLELSRKKLRSITRYIERARRIYESMYFC